MEILFQIIPYFRTHMYISSNVTHTKYAVAETRTSGVKRITVIHVLRNANSFFLIMQTAFYWFCKQLKTSFLL